MKILIVSKVLYPNNSPRGFRTTELVKELCRQGHNVTLYIVKESPVQQELATEFGFELKDLGPTKLKPVEDILKSKNSDNLFIRGIRRLLMLLFEYPGIELMLKVKSRLSRENNYDLLISIAVPHPIHWGVAWARTKKHQIAKVWVADCGDPYMGNRMDSFKKFFYFRYFEKWFCRKADFISVPAPDYIQYYYKEFHYKFRVIPQGFKFEDSKIFKGEIINEVPTFAFAGRFLKQIRDPRPLLDLLVELNLPFKFIVFTPDVEFLKPYEEKLGHKLENKGFVKRDDLLYELSKMDFLLHIEFHPSVKSNSPSKFADYYIANRPVLALNMENPEKDKIIDFLNKDYSKKMDLSDADKFQIENVVRQFISLIKND